ncbi:hypothetical protein [Sutcliffiella halmapala]|uniref:hypothetical protein n=1 Tax=Sutcliffiella halmapala TaxID=79882 RepID=UPI000994A018|nr:hypothetical protein [Sutcliffiella halmapala]
METSPTIVYDYFFNANEWFILITLIGGFGLVLILPKQFPLSHTLLFLLIGMNSGVVFDHTISIPPFDFYDVNDSSYFELYDFLSYIMYGPFAYFFFYFYQKWKIKGYLTMLYIIMWSIVAMFVEGLAAHFGVFHYKGGYIFIYSFPFYFLIQSLTLWLFTYIMKQSTVPAKYSS